MRDNIERDMMKWRRLYTGINRGWRINISITRMWKYRKIRGVNEWDVDMNNFWSIHITRFGGETETDEKINQRKEEGYDYERSGQNCTNMTIISSIAERCSFRFVGQRRKENIIQNTMTRLNRHWRHTIISRQNIRKKEKIVDSRMRMYVDCFFETSEKRSVQKLSEEGWWRKIRFTKGLSVCGYLYLDISISFLIPVHVRRDFAVMISVVLENGQKSSNRCQSERLVCSSNPHTSRKAPSKGKNRSSSSSLSDNRISLTCRRSVHALHVSWRNQTNLITEPGFEPTTSVAGIENF